MKVLWFTGIPMPEMLGQSNAEHASGGTWMIALLEQLAKSPDIELAVACAAPELRDETFRGAGGVSFHSISQNPLRRYISLCGLNDDKRLLDVCARLVAEISPDIVHVHGSERFYGLLGARGLCNVPVVTSIQGLVHQIAKPRAYFGVTPWRDILGICCPAHLLRDIGRLMAYLQFRGAMATRELEILRGNRWFMGRTLWDRACLEAVNPSAKYFHAPRLLRSEFYETPWDITRCQRHRIVFTNANTFYRGTEVLLEATAILKRDFEDVTLAVAGGGERSPWGKKLIQNARRSGIEGSVQLLGYINARQMVDELRRSHVYAIASLAENSPNSLCEAQLVGLPCIASYVGGIPSLVDEGITGFLFPPGDAAVLARRIKDVFLDDDLARTLSEGARQVALRRHDPALVTARVIETYRAVIADWTTAAGTNLSDGSSAGSRRIK